MSIDLNGLTWGDLVLDLMDKNLNPKTLENVDEDTLQRLYFLIWGELMGRAIEEDQSYE